MLTIPFHGIVKLIAYSGPRETIQGETREWYQVEYRGTTGYAFSAFLAAGMWLEPSRLAGSFRSTDPTNQYTPSSLTFRPDGTFQMSANVCENMIPLSGLWFFKAGPLGTMDLHLQFKSANDLGPVTVDASLWVKSPDTVMVTGLSPDRFMACEFRPYSETFNRFR
jgi:hypothetical protein